MQDTDNDSEGSAVRLLPRVREVTHHFNRYVALGDSFSAGPGASNTPVPGNNVDGGDCFRTIGGWPQQLNNVIQAGQFEFSACTGLNTTQIRTQQVTAVNSLFGTPDLVTITTGGNDDNSFANVVKTCPYFYGRFGDTSGGCSGALDAAHNTVNSDGFRNNINATVDAIRQSLAPHGVLMLMGYPRLYNDATTIGGDCWLIRARRRDINQLVTDLNNVLLAIAASWRNNLDFTIMVADPNSPNQPNVVPPGDLTFEGHRFCESSNRAYFQGLPGYGYTYNAQSWLTGMFHPNFTGMTVMAQTAQNALAGINN